MWYEIWDSDTGNQVGHYPTEEAALDAIVEDVGRYGRDSDVLLSLGLLRCDPEREQDGLIATGAALVERALSRAGTGQTNGVTTRGRTLHPSSS